MDVAVGLSVFEKTTVVLGPLAPLFFAAALVELPHHADEESTGPIGPEFAFVIPSSIGGIDREEVGMVLDEGR